MSILSRSPAALTTPLSVRSFAVTIAAGLALAVAPTAAAADPCAADSAARQALDAVTPAALTGDEQVALTEPLATVLGACPMLVATYGDLVTTFDLPGFWREHYRPLAEAINARPLVERLPALPVLWSLEFRVLPIERYPDLRQQVGRLAPRIDALDRRDDEAWWRARVAAAEIAGAPGDAERLRTTWHTEQPCAQEAIAARLGELARRLGDEANQVAIESDAVRFATEHQAEARTTLEGMVQRCPDDRRAAAWIAHLDAPPPVVVEEDSVDEPVEAQPTRSRPGWVDTSFLEFQNVIRPLEDWKAKDTEGRTWTRDDLSGQVTAIVLWATWCDPCMPGMPLFQGLHTAFADEPGLSMLTINLDRRRKPARRFLEEAGDRLSFPVLWGDEDLRKASRRLPLIWLVDGNGVVRRQSTGVHPEIEPALWIEAIRAEMERLAR